MRVEITFLAKLDAPGVKYAQSTDAWERVELIA